MRLSTLAICFAVGVVVGLVLFLLWVRSILPVAVIGGVFGYGIAMLRGD